MKLSLVLIAGLISATSVFAGATMPKELIGKYATSPELCKQEEGTEGLIVLTKNGYSVTYDFGCSPVKTISHKGNVFKILMSCSGDGDSDKSIHTYTIFNGGIKMDTESYKSCKK